MKTPGSHAVQKMKVPSFLFSLTAEGGFEFQLTFSLRGSNMPCAAEAIGSPTHPPLPTYLLLPSSNVRNHQHQRLNLLSSLVSWVSHVIQSRQCAKSKSSLVLLLPWLLPYSASWINNMKLEVQMPNKKQKVKSQHAKIGRMERQQGPVSLMTSLNG